MKNYSRYFFPIFIGQLFIMGLILTLIYFNDTLSLSSAIYFFFLYLFFQLFLFSLYYLSGRNFWLFLKTGKWRELKEDNSFLSKKVMKNFQNLNQIKDNEIKELEDKTKTQQMFTELWIHQMKTPVTVIDLLTKEDPISKKEIQHENKRLKEGLDLALNVSRLSNFSEDFLLKRYSLKDLCQRGINEEKEGFVYRKIFPELDVTDIEVIVDEKWFLFVLSQILQNSLKYTPPKGKILFKTDVKENHVNLEIIDTGMGIPKEDLSRITRPFFTGTNGRKYPNATGMGLYLVQEINEKMGITMDIQSGLNKGTTVILSLPL